ncbi:MAG: hypothetical protein RIS44_1428 [Pseudomonadota bacterium]
MTCCNRWLYVFLLSCIGISTAGATTVELNLTNLDSLGAEVVAAFDLIDGGSPSNQLQLTSLSTDGSFGAATQVGGVTGLPPGSTTLSDSAFFNELTLLLSGATQFSFRFTPSTNAPTAGGFPDSFSFFLLNSVTGFTLFETSDPTGSNALFSYSFDGTVQGDLQIYAPLIGGSVAWSLTDVSGNPEPNPVPLPSTAAMFFLGLLLLGAVRQQKKIKAIGALAVALCGLHMPSIAADLSSSVALTRSGFVLNRTTNTFDAQVTVRNTSPDSLSGPLKLIVDGVAPASVALYNSYGKTLAGKNFVLVPLNDGVLLPGQTAVGLLKLINIGKQVTQVQLGVEGERLSSNNTVQLNVSAYFASGVSGTQKGNAVGAGFVVKIDDYARGVTDASGKLLVKVPLSSKRVSTVRAPSEGGSALIPSPVIAGQSISVDVLVEDSKEIYADGILRFDQVQQAVLSRGAGRISLRFVQDEKPVRLSNVNYIDAQDINGNRVPLAALFSLQADGSIAATPSAFYQAVGGLKGKIQLTVGADDSSGAVYSDSTDFYMADFKVQIQLIAPPSNPNLPLAGVKVSGNVLNTDVFFTGESDANGLVLVPDLPAGNLSLDALTPFSGLFYRGFASTAINKNSLVKLTLRGPQDILNNVPVISVSPLATSSLGSNTKSLFGAAAGVQIAEVPIYSASQRQMREIESQRLSQSRAKPGADTKLLAATSTSVSVSVSGAAQDALVEQSKQLIVTKGTKKIRLKYSAATAEYPTYVLQQSIYNDTWSLSVLGGNGAPLFDIARQINSQLSQAPIWQSNGSTGEIKVDIDVTTLAAAADTAIILRATTTNVGDGILPTSVTAMLDVQEQFVIDSITTDTPAPLNQNNFYSIPRASSTNTLQRTAVLDITKPTGSTIDSVTVELRDGQNNLLMTTLAQVAPGQAGVVIQSQDATSAKLEVRQTMLNPASTVAGTPPPTRDLTYRFIVAGTDAQGSPITGEKDLSGKRSLWRMPDGFARFGGRDAGGDDWASRGAYGWMQTNAALLREINDVSGEHGRDLGHASHARGNDIDMFHFYVFPGIGTGAGQGLANFNSLRADVIASAGNTPAALTARARVVDWINQSRAGITALANLPSVSQVFYCAGPAVNSPAGANILPAGWCRSVLTQGSVNVSGVAVNFVNTTFNNAKMINNNVHNDHIHITLNPAQIQE